MKKVLFTSLNDHVPWGGSEELWSLTAIELSNSYNVYALIKKWKKDVPQIERLRNNGVEIIYKNTVVKKPKNYVNKILNKFSRKIRKTLPNKENSIYLKFDHIFISIGDHLDSKLIPLTRELIKYKVSYSIIVQLATDLRNIDDVNLKKINKAYTGAETVFFLSEENEFKTEMFFGCELINKVRINNPFNFIQNYTPIGVNGYNLASVASLTSFHKSQDLLISVLGQDKWKNRSFCLNLYGDGINKVQIEKIIKRYNLQDKVKINGFIKNKEDIWKSNMCCIMPSRMEGQSLAMLEAMSHGRMVIATNVGDAKRMVVEDETGFLIEAPTFSLIDTALEKAWGKRDDWVSYGVNARNHLFEQIKEDPIIDFVNKIKKIV